MFIYFQINYFKEHKFTFENYINDILGFLLKLMSLVGVSQNTVYSLTYYY